MKLETINENISFEKAMFTLLQLIENNKETIKIKNFMIIVKQKENNVLEELKSCFEVLCNYPFIFRHNTLQDEFFYDFQSLFSPEKHEIPSLATSSAKKTNKKVSLVY